MNRYRFISIMLFMSLIYGNEFQVLSGDIIQLDDVTRITGPVQKLSIHAFMYVVKAKQIHVTLKIYIQSP